ncbi:MAG: ABC transporter ATP-binding protein [Chloroflexi bacterium]|nr:ABC transporter ATP-binding protein [Chloroflexota bacterium]
MATVIKTEALCKWYGKVRGIQGLELTIGEGELFGFLGPNGAGKTTTIRILTGFLRPTGGRALVFGLDSWKDTTRIKARIGFLPDSPELYIHLTGLELLDYLSCLQGLDTSVLRPRLLDSLELSQADLTRQIKGYSRGMRKKLAIVQALQHNPELLIMDEPTESLDPLIQQAFFQVLLDYRSQGGTTFFSSHILPEVERLCTRVGIIRDGSLVAVEEVAELRKRTLRRIEIVPTQDIPEDRLRLDGVVSVERDGRRLRLVLRGDINPILRELAKLDLEDLVFEQPHLEDIFLSFYRTEHEGQ